MKRTILAAAVAMSFAGFANAELVLNVENDAVSYDAEKSSWVVADSVEEALKAAAKADKAATDKEYSYVVDKVTDKKNAKDLNTLAQGLYATQFNEHDTAVTASEAITEIVTENKKTIVENKKELAKQEALFVKSTADSIKIVALGKTLPDNGDTATFKDSNGKTITLLRKSDATLEISAEAGEKTPAEILSGLKIDELKATIKSDTEAGVLLEKDAAEKATAVLVKKAALDAKMKEVATTSLGLAAAQAAADVEVARLAVVDAKVAKVDAHTAQAVNTTLNELSVAKIDENGDIVTLDKNGDVASTLADLGGAATLVGTVADVADIEVGSSTANDETITEVELNKAIGAINTEAGKLAGAVGKNAQVADFAAKGVVANNKAIVKTAKFANENRSRIVKNETNIAANTAGIVQNTADIKELRLDFNDLKSDFYEFKSEASKGIAGVAAMSQMDSVYAAPGEYFVGAGVGGFNGESAVAIGMGYRHSESTSFRAAVSFANGDATPVWGAGATYTFK